jgi:shikimate kinase
MSVILIGMPSCGKSTLGVLLAKKLGYRFIDSDLLIQEREGMLLHDIIESKGIDGFLAIENEVNASITDTRAVISTGGSAVYGKEAMEHLRTLGSVVYLNISCDTMVSRLGDYVHRGVVLPEGYTLEDMYRERSVLYESYAEITVHTDSGDISTALEEISSVLVKKDKIRETP